MFLSLLNRQSLIVACIIAMTDGVWAGNWSGEPVRSHYSAPLLPVPSLYLSLTLYFYLVFLSLEISGCPPPPCYGVFIRPIVFIIFTRCHSQLPRLYYNQLAYCQPPDLLYMALSSNIYIFKFASFNLQLRNNPQPHYEDSCLWCFSLEPHLHFL